MTFDGYQKFKKIIGGVQIKSFIDQENLPAFRESKIYCCGYERCRADILSELEKEKNAQVEENIHDL